MKSDPFVELLYSGIKLSEESIKNLKEIEEINKRLEFLNNLTIGGSNNE